MASVLNNSANSSAIPATIASPVTTLPTKNSTIETSLDLSPLPTSLSNNSIPSATRRPTPTTTSSADDSSATYFAQITWFNAGKVSARNEGCQNQLMSILSLKMKIEPLAVPSQTMGTM